MQTTKQQAMEKVSKIDFSPIENRLRNIHGFDEARVLKTMRMYRKFLALMIMNPETPISPPSEDTDEAWHSHILHTKKYAKDCDMLFGSFRHHTPMYISDPALNAAGANMRRLWKENGF